MGNLLSSPPSMPKMQMPPPPPPPAVMDTPIHEEGNLELGEGAAEKETPTKGNKRYRAKNRGMGKSGGHKSYKGGGLSGV